MNKFEISILKYRHSYHLGEELNIGVLIYSSSIKKLIFIYPPKLQRLSNVYPDISLSQIKSFLKDFDKLVEGYNKALISNTSSNQNTLYDLNSSKFSELNSIISSKLLPIDSSAFYFTKAKKGTTVELRKYVEYQRQELLQLYSSRLSRERKNEEYVNNKIESFVNKEPVLKKNITSVVLKSEHFEEQYKYCWKNHHNNIITPVSFDYTNPASIDEKAWKIHGKLESFKSVVEQSDYKFDLIVTSPKSKDLFKKYENALKFLETISTSKSIIHETHLDDYFKNAKSFLLSAN